MEKRILSLAALALAAMLSGCASSQVAQNDLSDDMIFNESLEETTADTATAQENMPSDIEAVKAQLRSIDGHIVDTKARIAKLQKSSNGQATNEAQAELSEYETQKEALTTHKENLEMAETLE